MLHQFINRLIVNTHFPLDCLDVFHYFDIVICTNSNIFDQFAGSKNFKILRQQMWSHRSNVSPWFAINGNSRWARWLPYYWKLSTPCCREPASSQGYRSFPRHQLPIIDTCCAIIILSITPIKIKIYLIWLMITQASKKIKSGIRTLILYSAIKIIKCSNANLVIVKTTMKTQSFYQK